MEPSSLKLVKWKWKSLSCVQLFATPWTIQSRNFPGQKTEVGSLSLLQGIFLTQGSNPGLPYCRQILYQLSHKVRRPQKQGTFMQEGFTGLTLGLDMRSGIKRWLNLLQPANTYLCKHLFRVIHSQEKKQSVLCECEKESIRHVTKGLSHQLPP